MRGERGKRERDGEEGGICRDKGGRDREIEGERGRDG